MGLQIHGGKGAAVASSATKAAWLKTGSEAAQGLQQEETQREAERESRGKLWRYYLRPEDEGTVTFLTGTVIEDKEHPDRGLFDVPHVREHKVVPTGRKVPDFYVCVSAEETCPLCEADNRASYVGVFAVIDHRVSKSRDGSKVYTNQKRIFAAKGNTLKQLAKKAKHNNGTLVGCTIEISRGDQQTATVGSDFEVLGQNSLEAIGKKIDPVNWEDVVAEPDWETELSYLPGDELRAMFGLGGVSPGYTGSAAPSVPVDVPSDDELPGESSNGDDDGIPF